MLGWAPLLGLLLTMPVYAARARGRTFDTDVARRGASIVLGHWVRDWMVWVIGPIERLLIRKRTLPDTLNFAGVVLGLLAGASFIARAPVVAAWCIALSGVSDILDGRVARALGVTSARGEFLDSTLDRFAETFTFVGVAWYLSGTAWMAAATVLAIGGSLLVSYTRARGEAVGVTCTAGLVQRAERIVLLAIASLFDSTVTRALEWSPGALLAGAVVAIAVGSIGTAIYRTIVITRALARRGGEVSPAESERERETGDGVRE